MSNRSLLKARELEVIFVIKTQSPAGGYDSAPSSAPFLTGLGYAELVAILA